MGWDEKNNFSEAYQRALRLSVKKSQWKNHRLQNPYELQLVQVHEAPLSEHIKTYKRDDKRLETVEILSSLLQDRLHEALKTVPDKMSMKIGKLASVPQPEMTRTNRNTVGIVEVVSALPAGWAESEKNHKTSTRNDGCVTLDQLAAESGIYKDTLTEVCEWLTPESVVLDPIVPLLRRADGYPIANATLRHFQDVLAADETAPTEFPLSDPVIIVRMGKFRRDQYELCGRIPAEQLVSPLAA